MQRLRSFFYLRSAWPDGCATPELLREAGARCDEFSQEKSPLHAHLENLEAQLAAFERLRQLAERHNWAKEGGTLKEKLQRATAAGDHEAAATIAQMPGSER